MSIIIKFVSREVQHSEYDWADISKGTDRVGKARCKVEDSTITIHSINIYPEFEGSGYGKQFVGYCKNHFNIVIADRVRPTAVGFWKAVGFHNNNKGDWIYKKRSKRGK